MYTCIMRHTCPGDLGGAPGLLEAAGDRDSGPGCRRTCFMCMCVYIYIYIYTYYYYYFIYWLTYVFLCTYVYIYIYSYLLIYVCTYIYIYWFLYLLICWFMYTFMYAYVHLLIIQYTNMIYRCRPPRWPPRSTRSLRAHCFKNIMTSIVHARIIGKLHELYTSNVSYALMMCLLGAAVHLYVAPPQRCRIPFGGSSVTQLERCWEV